MYHSEPMLLVSRRLKKKKKIEGKEMKKANELQF